MEKYEDWVVEYRAESATLILAWAVTEAAGECLVAIDERQNNEYISDKTLQLVRKKEEARQDGQTTTEQELNKQIKKGARTDKKKGVSKN